ncbi:MAG: ATP-binding protein [Sterolibacterium sp.]
MANDIEQKLGLGTRPAARTSNPHKFKSTLAFKGVLTLTVMVVYFVVVSIVIAYERNSLIDSVQLLNEIHKREEHVVALNIMVARAILTVNENYFSPNVGISSKILVLEIEGVLTGLKKLGLHYSPIAEDAALLSKSMAELQDNPKLTVVADIRGIFHRIVVDLDAIASDIRSRKQWLLEDYEHTHNRLTINWIVFVVVGLGCLSGLMMWFFRRLAADIQNAQERATEIVRGYRGTPLPVKRQDELGDLIGAVNNMQEELRKREAQLEISRQQQFHKEKMAAIGSLSASVAHEINNPLSAIIGIAQSMVDAQDCGCAKTGAPCQPQLVIEQAKRVMQITRQLGQVSIPQSQNPELIDINGLVRSTCNFVSFDQRLRRLELVQNLDPDLPAVYAVADHIVQVLMNLLINAADALENCTDSPPRIAITTDLRDGAVRISVNDNGCGISPENLGKVFIEHFTTKAPGRGYGLGLALCRSLINSAGGLLTIDSHVGKGTTVAISLPLPLLGIQAERGNEREPPCMS